MTKVYTLREDDEYLEVIKQITVFIRESHLNPVEVAGVLRLVELELFMGVDDSD